MKRHLLVTNDFPPKVGGIQNYLWELWRRLDPASYVVLTASSDPGAAAFDAAQAGRGVRIERVPGTTLFFPTAAALAAVRTCVADNEIDMVLLDPVLPLGLLGPRLGVPYGVVLHGAEVTVPGRIPGSHGALGRVLRGARLVVSAGNYPAAEGRRVAGDAMGPQVVIPPGVDTGAIVPLEAPERRAARARLGLPRRGPLVVSVSRLVPRKGMDVLIEAAARLAPSYPDLVVAIGGEGRELARLRRLAGQSPLTVEVLGAGQRRGPVRPARRSRRLRHGLPEPLAGAWSRRASASSSSRRPPPGSPRSPATAAGRPRPCSTGSRAWSSRSPQDPGAVAEALRSLLADPTRRRRMGRAARSRVHGILRQRRSRF